MNPPTESAAPRGRNSGTGPYALLSSQSSTLATIGPPFDGVFLTTCASSAKIGDTRSEILFGVFPQNTCTRASRTALTNRWTYSSSIGYRLSSFLSVLENAAARLSSRVSRRRDRRTTKTSFAESRSNSSLNNRIGPDARKSSFSLQLWMTLTTNAISAAACVFATPSSMTCAQAAATLRRCLSPPTASFPRAPTKPARSPRRRPLQPRRLRASP